MKIVIIDYGMGNNKSIQNQLNRIGVNSIISNKSSDLKDADKLILPGVGHFDNGIDHLNKHHLIETLNKRVLIDNIPILGICLGMQLFAKDSEEGMSKGLGWIDAHVVRFSNSKLEKQFRIPHIGWNNLNIQRQSNLLEGIDEQSFFYFVHSYYLYSHDSKIILATTEYSEKFTSVVQKKNIFGTQFHPEKSHDAGIRILKNFCRI